MLVDSIYINFVSIVREQMAKWAQGGCELLLTPFLGSSKLVASGYF